MEQTEEPRREMEMVKGFDLFIKASQRYQKSELSKFASEFAFFSIALLRGVEGEEYVKGFLESSLNDKNPAIITPGGLDFWAKSVFEKGE